MNKNKNMMKFFCVFSMVVLVNNSQGLESTSPTDINNGAGNQLMKMLTKDVVYHERFSKLESTKELIGDAEAQKLARKGAGNFSFTTGTMESGKSAELLKFVKSLGRDVRPWDELSKSEYVPSNDKISVWGFGGNTRDEDYIRSRNGQACHVDYRFYDNTDFETFAKKNSQVSSIIIDEAQFLNPTQVIQLKKLSILGMNVHTYGLLKDFKGIKFAASAILNELSNVVVTLKCPCKICESNVAEINARIDGNGHVVREGAQVQIGGSESYWPLCEDCFRTH